MLRLKIHLSGKEVLVAAADADLVGRTFKKDGLKITVHEHFYGSEHEVADEPTLLARLAACTVANLVGEAAVGAAIRGGFVDAASVIRIDGIPHAQLAVL